jgi:hypothetical protein
MTAAAKRYRYVGAHLDDLHDGRIIEPGAYVTLTDEEADHPHNQHRFDDGLLIEAPKHTAAAAAEKGSET